MPEGRCRRAALKSEFIALAQVACAPGAHALLAAPAENGTAEQKATERANVARMILPPTVMAMRPAMPQMKLWRKTVAHGFPETWSNRLPQPKRSFSLQFLDGALGLGRRCYSALVRYSSALSMVEMRSMK